MDMPDLIPAQPTLALPPVLGLATVALFAGLSLDALRKRIQREPYLRHLFTDIGGTWTLATSQLPTVVPLLTSPPVG